MIQRIQSIFLAIIVVLEIAFQFLTIHTKNSADAQRRVVMDAWHIILKGNTANTGTETILSTQDIWYVGSLGLLAGTLALISIVQYKSRINQMKLGIGLSLVTLAQAISIFILSKEADNLIDSQSYGVQQLGFYIPFICLLMNMGANRFIRRDEQLVKSMDRLR
jgi:Domain of unknown function (DUF4293)